jgi:outer membrane protein assembly factor BamB
MIPTSTQEETLMRTQLTVDDLVIIGIKGTVLALYRETGQEVWRTKLKGCDFTNLTRDGDRVYAAASGELFCLEGATGAVLWNNPLKGMGFGIVTIASADQTPAATRRRQDDDANSATMVSTNSTVHST